MFPFLIKDYVATIFALLGSALLDCPVPNLAAVSGIILDKEKLAV